MLQQLSGAVWSDYNPHDPGVTMLDLLNYALLELEYKLNFPFEEYLGGKEGGELHTQRLGVPVPDDFFSDAVVTPADYEQLILEQKIEGIKDCRVTLDERGLYRIVVETIDGSDLYGIRRAVEKLYHAHRNLCENLGEIGFGKISGRRKRTPDERPSIRPGLSPILSYGMATGTYRSVQLDFPDCYGINENGIPVGATAEHHARIRQLKGYLLIFDYLMKHATGQAAAASGLFELSGRTPYYKVPAIQIPGIREFIDRERISAARIDRSDFRKVQKSRYLDMLDVISGEDTSTLFTRHFRTLSEVNRLRAELLAQLPRLHAERFRSFDLSDENPGAVPGVKRFLSAFLGFLLTEEKPLTHIFSHHHLKLIRDSRFFDRQSILPNLEFLFREAGHNWDPADVETIPHTEIVYNEQAVHRLRKRINLLWHNIIFESFLVYGQESDYYRIVHLKKEEEYLLVFKHPQMERWINLGAFRSREGLIETANILWQFLTQLVYECSSFYLLEHILLNDGAGETANPDENHTLSVLIPYWVQKLYHPAQYESLLTERLPAHLEVRFLWLHADRLYSFEHLYFSWKKALSSRQSALAGRLAIEIRQFLENTPAYEHGYENNA